MLYKKIEIVDCKLYIRINKRTTLAVNGEGKLLTQ